MSLTRVRTAGFSKAADPEIGSAAFVFFQLTYVDRIVRRQGFNVDRNNHTSVWGVA